VLVRQCRPAVSSSPWNCGRPVEPGQSPEDGRVRVDGFLLRRRSPPRDLRARRRCGPTRRLAQSHGGVGAGGGEGVDWITERRVEVVNRQPGREARFARRRIRSITPPCGRFFFFFLPRFSGRPARTRHAMTHREARHLHHRRGGHVFPACDWRGVASHRTARIVLRPERRGARRHRRGTMPLIEYGAEP